MTTEETVTMTVKKLNRVMKIVDRQGEILIEIIKVIKEQRIKIDELEEKLND